MRNGLSFVALIAMALVSSSTVNGGSQALGRADTSSSQDSPSELEFLTYRFVQKLNSDQPLTAICHVHDYSRAFYDLEQEPLDQVAWVSALKNPDLDALSPITVFEGSDRAVLRCRSLQSIRQSPTSESEPSSCDVLIALARGGLEQEASFSRETFLPTWRVVAVCVVPVVESSDRGRPVSFDDAVSMRDKQRVFNFLCTLEALGSGHAAESTTFAGDPRADQIYTRLTSGIPDPTITYLNWRRCGGADRGRRRWYDVTISVDTMLGRACGEALVEVISTSTEPSTVGAFILFNWVFHA